MFIRLHYSEAKLIKVAASWEAASAARNLVRPCITSNIEIELKNNIHSIKVYHLHTRKRESSSQRFLQEKEIPSLRRS